MASMHSTAAYAAAVLVLAFAEPAAVAQQPFPGALPGLEIGTANLPPGFEPSDCVWHPRLRRLFVVDDGGLLASTAADGTNVQLATVGGDLEGVCIADPDSNRIYLGREHPDAVLEWDLTTNTVTRTFDLTPYMTGPNNQGLEALTFVPIAGHPQGGEFYAGLQDTGVIHRFSLPVLTSSTSTAVTFVGTFRDGPALDDISGMDFDRSTGTLYAIYDAHDVVRATRNQGTVAVGEWVLPGHDQEGIALACCGRLFVAEDVGVELFRYEGFPTAQPATWTNYGAGHPGTLGVPSFGFAGAPRLGTTTAFSIGNSNTQPTVAGILVGVARANTPTQFGGTLLVDPPIELGVWFVGVGTAQVPVQVPEDPYFCGLLLDFQLVELDDGASDGVSFSAGLEAVFGR